MKRRAAAWILAIAMTMTSIPMNTVEALAGEAAPVSVTEEVPAADVPEEAHSVDMAADVPEEVSPAGHMEEVPSGELPAGEAFAEAASAGETPAGTDAELGSDGENADNAVNASDSGVNAAEGVSGTYSPDKAGDAEDASAVSDDSDLDSAITFEDDPQADAGAEAVFGDDSEQIVEEEDVQDGIPLVEEADIDAIDAGEADGTTQDDQAIPLTLDQPETAAWNTNGRTEYKYSFTPAETGLYRFYTSGENSVTGSLYDASSNLIASSLFLSDGSNTVVKAQLTEGQTYYYRVVHDSNGSETTSSQVIVSKSYDPVSVDFTVENPETFVEWHDPVTAGTVVSISYNTEAGAVTEQFPVNGELSYSIVTKYGDVFWWYLADGFTDGSADNIKHYYGSDNTCGAPGTRYLILGREREDGTAEFLQKSETAADQPNSLETVSNIPVRVLSYKEAAEKNKVTDGKADAEVQKGQYFGVAFTAAESGYYQFDYSCGQDWVGLYTADEGSDPETYSAVNIGYKSSNQTVTTDALQKGKEYYFLIKSPISGKAHVTVTNPQADASELMTGQTESPSWTENDHAGRFYKFTPSEAGDYLFCADHAAGVRGNLYDAEGNLIAQASADGSGRLRVMARLAEGQTCYFEVHPEQADADLSKASVGVQYAPDTASVDLSYSGEQSVFTETMDPLDAGKISEIFGHLSMTIHYQNGEDETIGEGTVSRDGLTGKYGEAYRWYVVSGFDADGKPENLNSGASSLSEAGTHYLVLGRGSDGDDPNFMLKSGAGTGRTSSPDTVANIKFTVLTRKELAEQHKVVDAANHAEGTVGARGTADAQSAAGKWVGIAFTPAVSGIYQFDYNCRKNDVSLLTLSASGSYQTVGIEWKSEMQTITESALAAGTEYFFFIKPVESGEIHFTVTNPAEDATEIEADAETAVPAVWEAGDQTDRFFKFTASDAGKYLFYADNAPGTKGILFSSDRKKLAETAADQDGKIRTLYTVEEAGSTILLDLQPTDQRESKVTAGAGVIRVYDLSAVDLKYSGSNDPYLQILNEPAISDILGHTSVTISYGSRNTVQAGEADDKSEGIDGIYKDHFQWYAAKGFAEDGSPVSPSADMNLLYTPGQWYLVLGQLIGNNQSPVFAPGSSGGTVARIPVKVVSLEEAAQKNPVNGNDIDLTAEAGKYSGISFTADKEGYYQFDYSVAQKGVVLYPAPEKAGGQEGSRIPLSWKSENQTLTGEKLSAGQEYYFFIKPAESGEIHISISSPGRDAAEATPEGGAAAAWKAGEKGEKYFRFTPEEDQSGKYMFYADDAQGLSGILYRDDMKKLESASADGSGKLELSHELEGGKTYLFDLYPSKDLTADVNAAVGIIRSYDPVSVQLQSKPQKETYTAGLNNVDLDQLFAQISVNVTYENGKTRPVGTGEADPSGFEGCYRDRYGWYVVSGFSSGEPQNLSSDVRTLTLAGNHYLVLARKDKDGKAVFLPKNVVTGDFAPSLDTVENIQVNVLSIRQAAEQNPVSDGKATLTGQTGKYAGAAFTADQEGICQFEYDCDPRDFVLYRMTGSGDKEKDERVPLAYKSARQKLSAVRLSKGEKYGFFICPSEDQEIHLTVTNLTSWLEQTSTEIKVGESKTAEWAAGDPDKKYFRFTPKESGKYCFYSMDADYPLACLYDPLMKEVKNETVLNDGENGFRYVAALQANEEYLLEVSNSKSETMQITLRENEDLSAITLMPAENRVQTYIKDLDEYDLKSLLAGVKAELTFTDEKGNSRTETVPEEAGAGGDPDLTDGFSTKYGQTYRWYMMSFDSDGKREGSIDPGASRLYLNEGDWYLLPVRAPERIRMLSDTLKESRIRISVVSKKTAAEKNPLTVGADASLDGISGKYTAAIFTVSESGKYRISLGAEMEDVRLCQAAEETRAAEETQAPDGEQAAEGTQTAAADQTPAGGQTEKAVTLTAEDEAADGTFAYTANLESGKTYYLLVKADSTGTFTAGVHDIAAELLNSPSTGTLEADSQGQAVQWAEGDQKEKFFRFKADENSVYMFYSGDAKGVSAVLYGDGMKKLASAKADTDGEFRISYRLEKGSSYLLQMDPAGSKKDRAATIQVMRIYDTKAIDLKYDGGAECPQYYVEGLNPVDIEEFFSHISAEIEYDGIDPVFVAKGEAEQSGVTGNYRDSYSWFVVSGFDADGNPQDLSGDLAPLTWTGIHYLVLARKDKGGEPVFLPRSGATGDFKASLDTVANVKVTVLTRRQAAELHPVTGGAAALNMQAGKFTGLSFTAEADAVYQFEYDKAQNGIGLREVDSEGKESDVSLSWVSDNKTKTGRALLAGREYILFIRTAEAGPVNVKVSVFREDAAQPGGDGNGSQGGSTEGNGGGSQGGSTEGNGGGSQGGSTEGNTGANASGEAGGTVQMTGQEAVSYIGSLDPEKLGFKVKRLQKGKVRATWNPLTGVSGYRIRFSMKKNMKKCRYRTIRKPGKATRTIRKLARRKYYFQIQAYVVVSGKKYYSAWSRRRKVRA